MSSDIEDFSSSTSGPSSTDSLGSESDRDDEVLVFQTPQKRRYRRLIFNQKRRCRPRHEEHVESMADDLAENRSLDETFSSSEGATPTPLDIWSSGLSEDDISVDSDVTTSEITDDSSCLFDSEEELLENNSNCDEQTDNDCFDRSSNTPIYSGATQTRLTSYVSIMLFVIKHSLTKEAFSDLLVLMQIHLPKPSTFTSSVYKLKEFLKMQVCFKEPRKHYTCGTCGCLLLEDAPCVKPECIQLYSKVHVFHDLNMEQQIEEHFKDHQFCKMLKMEEETSTAESGGLSDMCDGIEYKRLANLQQITPAEKNFTFTMNTDGVALFSSTYKGSLWPVYLALNELPVRLRFSRKYLIPTHLYCQHEKPNMLVYLSPLMDILKKLHNGITIDTAVGTFLLRFHLLATSLDLPAKAMVLNMKQFNGKHGCTYCLDKGSNPENRPLLRIYPFNEMSIPRTHDSILSDARRAANAGEAINGVKGATPLITLRYVDLPKLFVIDWMHCVLLGVVKTMLGLWLDTAFKGKVFYLRDKLPLINQRLKGIKVPDFISRQQRSLEDYKHWKATECREWLLHYSVPVLHGIMNADVLIHYCLLTTAMFLLNKETVSTTDVDFAEDCLEDFCRLFVSCYGIEKQTMNVHLLRHLPQCVRLHGPLFQYSCFGFENMNKHIKKMVHGTRFINEQICFAVHMAKCLPDLVKRAIMETDNDTKALMERLSDKHTSEDLSSKSIQPLGKKKIHIPSLSQRNFLNSGGDTVLKFLRVKSGVGVLYSIEYARVRNRNSYTFLFCDNNVKRFAQASYFLNFKGNTYAAVQELKVVTTTLLPFSDLKNHALQKYEEGQLCPQYVLVEHTDNVMLIPVGSIQCKCVYMKCGGNIFLSISPNKQEHN